MYAIRSYYDINTKVDRASMAHSLEVREPLMDHPLIEWLATLPNDMKIKGQEGKFRNNFV